MDPNGSRFSLEVESVLAAMTRDEIRPSYMEALIAHIAHVNKIVQDFLANVQRLESDPDFTTQGRQHRIAELGMDAASRLNALAPVIQGYEDHIESLMRARKEPPTPGNEMIRELRAVEIRSWASNAFPDQLALAAEYLSWTGSALGDEKALAIENSPVKLVSDEILAQGKEARSLRQSPEQAKQIRELRSLQQTLRSAMDAAMQTLYQHGYPRPDTLLATASGE